MSSTVNINEYTGKAIREIRQSKNMTLNELAHSLNISYQQLQKYEKGTNRLSIDKLYEISNLLGIEINNFFPGADFSFMRDDIQKLQAAEHFAAIKDEEMKAIILKLMGKLSSKLKDASN